MNKLMVLMSLMVWAGVVRATEISGVTVTQDATKHLVTVGYTLADGPAIVTFDVTSGGQSIGFDKLRVVTGDVNRKFANGSHAFTWRPEEAWDLVSDRTDLKVEVKAWALDNPPPYMAMELFGNRAIYFYPAKEALPFPDTDYFYKSRALLMRKIPAGGITWTMGAAGGTGNQTEHSVTFTGDYYIGVYPLTLAQCLQTKGNGYRSDISKAMGESDLAKAYSAATSAYGLTRPAVGLAYTWHLRGNQRNDSAYNWPSHKDVQASMLIGYLRGTFPGFAFDLPTQARWEYACRAGVGTAFNDGSDTDPGDVAWYAANNADDSDWVEGMPHAVGLKKPNAFGLYDLHGNVDEWTLDCWTTNALADETEPEGPIDTSAGGCNRVIRGGSFATTALEALSSSVQQADGNSGGVQSMHVGFRICCPAVAQ